MRSKLLLINPWIYDFTAYDLWSKPLGLLYLASFLRSYGFDVSYIDCLDKYNYHGNPLGKIKLRKDGRGTYLREEVQKPDILKHIPRRYARYGIGEAEFRRRLQEHKDCYAVLVTSMMTYWYPGVKRTVEIIREELPGLPVILGGIYATLLPGHARETIQPDFLVTGPGEIKILQILSEMNWIDCDSAERPKSLDDYPAPAFDLINHPDYLPVMTARGCPYSCSFCAQKIIAMPYSRRDPQKVVSEIREHAEKFRIRDFAFYDDALFINRDKHIKIILEGLTHQRTPLRLHSPNGLFARDIDAHLAELMWRSGFKTIRLSFETSNEKRRKDMNSKVNNSDMVRAVNLLIRAGYQAHQLESYVLMGLPFQTMEEIIASILFVHNLGVLVKLASFSPIPGTLEFKRAVEAGLIEYDIDPLLTNKTIFPLNNQELTYNHFRQIRSFTQILNEAAQRGLRLFGDNEIGTVVKNLIRSESV